MKKYVLILLFNKTADKVLLIKRNRQPFKNLYNGVAGKIEDTETEEQSTIRECFEETGIKLICPKKFMTMIYPKSRNNREDKSIAIYYDFIEEVNVNENIEGTFEWKNMEFVMDFHNKQIAGFSNLAQFIKEIRDIEGIKKFYE